MKTAILFGASGNIGAHLLQLLLSSDEYTTVKIVVRNDISIFHPKLRRIKADYYSLENVKESLDADDLFIIIGSTDKIIERKYPVLIAKMCKEQNVKNISIVTSVGANAKSKISFVRIKGEIEKDIIRLNFSQTHIFRPGMIMGEREKYRPMEKTMMCVWKIINPVLFGNLRKYRGMKGSDIARAIYLTGNNRADKVNIYHWQEMKQLIEHHIQ